MLKNAGIARCSIAYLGNFSNLMWTSKIFLEISAMSVIASLAPY